MSTLTRIYLAAAGLTALAWAGYSTLGPTRAAELDYRFDPAYLIHHKSELRGYLGGRVDVGEGVEIPREGLFVDVRAADSSGDLAVRRLAPVAADGTFEVSGIPKGHARVAVELGSAEVIWECKDIVVGGPGVVDGRIDPIDLRGRVFPFELTFTDPDGEPVVDGEFLWRPLAGDSEDVHFGTPTSIRGGQARFLATASMIDVISLVPGASVEFFEGVRAGQTIHLGPGTTAEIHVVGDLPDPQHWRVYALLVPMELTPKLPMAKRGRSATEAVMFAEVDSNQVASIPIARAGRYRLLWRMQHVRRQNRRPETIEDDAGLDIELEHAAGVVALERRFPMESFAQGLRARR